MTPEERAELIMGESGFVAAAHEVIAAHDGLEARVAAAIRAAENETADKIIREIEEAAAARDSEDLTHISQYLRARLDRATADD